MSNEGSWYEVIRGDADLTQYRDTLGVKEGASPEEIQQKFSEAIKAHRESLKKAQPSDRDAIVDQVSEAEHAFEVLSDSLEQGDILFNCPVATVKDLDVAALIASKEPSKKPSVGIDIYTVIVLSQSCDLRNAKIENVVVGQVIDWKSACIAEYKSGNTLILKPEMRKKIGEGNLPSLSLLYKHAGKPKLEWSVVDFHHLYMVPKFVLQDVARVNRPRLRLRTPYKEYLAQAFARYFMRVGLPLSADLFEIDGALDAETEKKLKTNQL